MTIEMILASGIKPLQRFLPHIIYHERSDKQTRYSGKFLDDKNKTIPASYDNLGLTAKID